MRGRERGEVESERGGGGVRVRVRENGRKDKKRERIKAFNMVSGAKQLPEPSTFEHFQGDHVPRTVRGTKGFQHGNIR